MLSMGVGMYLSGTAPVAVSWVALPISAVDTSPRAVRNTYASSSCVDEGLFPARLAHSLVSFGHVQPDTAAPLDLTLLASKTVARKTFTCAC